MQYKSQVVDFILYKNGSDGTSVNTVTAEFYLSTSKTTQTGGEWITSMPEWSAGTYLWTRMRIVYVNPERTEYTEPVCDSSWEAVNDISVGGRNLIRNSVDLGFAEYQFVKYNSYNNVKLGDIDAVWTDKETYPHAYITRTADVLIDKRDEPKYKLHLCANPAYRMTNTSSAIYSDGAAISYYSINGNKWEYESSTEKSTLVAYVDWWDILWTNETVLHGDGTAYFTASDPVAISDPTKTNVIQSHNTTSPIRIDETCAKLVIEDPMTPFVLHDILPLPQEYALSFWIKADAESSMTVVDNTIPITKDWTKHSLTFESTAIDLVMSFNTVSTCYIYHPKLEVGNKETDWSPAPEDVNDSINAKGEELGQAIVNQTEATIKDANSYTDNKLKDYVDKSRLETFEKEISAQLEVDRDKVGITIESITKQVESVDSQLVETVNKLEKHFDFTENGLVIAVADNPFKTTIDNDRYSMTMNDDEVLYFDGYGKGYIPDLTVDRAFNILGLRFEKDAYGNLNCEYCGGE